MAIIIVVLVIGIIIVLYNIYHDKLNFVISKLNNIEEKLKSTLLKRKELIKDAEELIREKLKTEKNIFDGLENLKDNGNIMELDRKLLIYIGEFHLIKEKYTKLNKDEKFKKIAFAITETEDLLNAYKEYYNDNASKYNKIIKTFPLIIPTILKRRKEKLFFDNKSIDDIDYSDFKY